MMPCLCWVLKAPGLLEVGGLGQEGAEFPPALVLCRLWTWTPKEIRTGRAYGPCRRISASLVSHGFVTTALEVCCFPSKAFSLSLMETKSHTYVTQRVEMRKKMLQV